MEDSDTPLSESLDARALSGSMFDYTRLVGPDLLGRTEAFEAWRSRRAEAGVWPFSRVLCEAPAPTMNIEDEAGHGQCGISLACQDYLGLTSHPAVREAALGALKDFGPHSAGSPALAGNTRLSQQLERSVGQALGFEHVALFPTGWAAGFGAIAGLVRRQDHIVMDQLAHACLQQGAFAATSKVHRHQHLDLEDARRILRKIRAEDGRNGILVVTEGLFSMDSDVPDIAALQEMCHEYGATLLVDVAHDFGSLGPRGGGSLAAQDLLGKVDLVMGSFSKTFASNGGFLATQLPAVRQYVKFYGSPQTFSNALSPIQTAVILEALRIVRSEEGERLRARMLDNARNLRRSLQERDVHCFGVPSAIVAAHAGQESVGRIAWALASRRGVHTNLVEFPAVAVGASRFRMQLMPSHTTEQLEQVGEIVASSIVEAGRRASTLEVPIRARARTSLIPGERTIGADALPALKPGDLRRLLKKARTQRFVEGATVIRSGTDPKSLCLVRQGTAEAVIEHNGAQIVVAECGAGEIFGEMSLLDGQGETASVLAGTDLEVSWIDQALLDDLSSTDPDFALRFYRSLSVVLARRLRSTNVPMGVVETGG